MWWVSKNCAWIINLLDIVWSQSHGCVGSYTVCFSAGGNQFQVLFRHHPPALLMCPWVRTQNKQSCHWPYTVNSAGRQVERGFPHLAQFWHISVYVLWAEWSNTWYCCCSIKDLMTSQREQNSCFPDFKCGLSSCSEKMCRFSPHLVCCF